MTLRERILAVYRGETPDVAPYMLDLSHWFYHRFQMPWDLSVAYEQPEKELIDYHRKHGVGFYIANCAPFYSAKNPADVKGSVSKGKTDAGDPWIEWRLDTPLGSLARRRIWEEQSYSWGIRDWAVQTPEHLRILAYALKNRRFSPRWDLYQAWVDYVGDTGVVYMPVGYSGMGQLLSYWMGIEGVIYATADFPDALHETVDAINANQLELVDLLCESPAEVIIMGDNFSSDVQPPHFFDEWSRAFYEEAIRRFHKAGKPVAVHIDGRLRGALDMFRKAGADCADAVTPTPMGDLTPAECRVEAGPDMILSGGVPPNLWLPEAPIELFKEKAIEWLELKKQGPRFIANAGDQVPPGADERRIAVMRDLVETYGRYR